MKKITLLMSLLLISKLSFAANVDFSSDTLSICDQKFKISEISSLDSKSLLVSLEDVLNNKADKNRLKKGYAILSKSLDESLTTEEKASSKAISFQVVLKSGKFSYGLMDTVRGMEMDEEILLEGHPSQINIKCSDLTELDKKLVTIGSLARWVRFQEIL